MKYHLKKNNQTAKSGPRPTEQVVACTRSKQHTFYLGGNMLGGPAEMEVLYKNGLVSICLTLAIRTRITLTCYPPL